MNNIQILKRLFNDYTKKYVPLILLALLFSLILAASTSSIAWLLDPAIEKLFIQKDQALMVLIPLGIIVAFATRYPNTRIALLYCKGKFQRKGYGSKLLHKLEDEAKKEGLNSLSTEASLISYKLFLKNKWKIIRKEKVTINNIFFERYKMIKII